MYVYFFHQSCPVFTYSPHMCLLYVQHLKQLEDTEHINIATQQIIYFSDLIVHLTSLCFLGCQC